MRLDPTAEQRYASTRELKAGTLLKQHSLAAPYGVLAVDKRANQFLAPVYCLPSGALVPWNFNYVTVIE
jgi:hypothetical protein